MSDEQSCDHKGYDVEFTPAGPKPSCPWCGATGYLIFDGGPFDTVRDGVQVKAGRIEWSAEDEQP